MTARADHAGRRYGLLVALEYVPAAHGGRWRCLCDCGTEKLVVAAQLVKGRTTSCGCRRRAVLATSNLKHGQTGSPTWSVWRDMHKRCNNPNADNFKHYGARGITVCERWAEFSAFFGDMGERPEGSTLERVDVDGDYEPRNCIWLPAKQQANNTRRTIRVNVNGEQMSLKEACDLLGVPYNRTRDRIKTLGWSFEAAVSTPKKVNGTIYAAEDRS